MGKTTVQHKGVLIPNDSPKTGLLNACIIWTNRSYIINLAPQQSQGIKKEDQRDLADAERQDLPLPTVSLVS